MSGRRLRTETRDEDLLDISKASLCKNHDVMASCLRTSIFLICQIESDEIGEMKVSRETGVPSL